MKRLRVKRLSLAILLVLALQAGGGQALAYRPGVTAWRPYHWPVKPFGSQHPVQSVFGDPRTVYELQPFGRTGPKLDGSYSFHNGVDIYAKAGTPVYPVVSGLVVVALPDEIVVRAGDGRAFQYYHLDKAVNRGQWAVAEQTILGTVKARYCHVHLAEIDWHHVHNPLDPGHLTPYRDWTTPVAVGLYIDNGGGPRPLVAGHLGARDRLVVAATDRPVLPVLGPLAGLPQVPALVEWRLVHGGVPTAWKVAADFRLTLPPPRAYWQIYAPGTYQNCPVFEHRLYSATPGRYLFRLGLEASRLAAGSYRIQVRVADIRRKASVASWPLRIGR
jgi:Peptidase family M23